MTQIYGAVSDPFLPIGGGAGYIKMLTAGDVMVDNLDDLINALDTATPGTVIFIDGYAEIDLTTRIFIDKIELTIAAGVTLASDRGHRDSPGALLKSDTADTPALIRVNGVDVRITGLRIQGPTPGRNLYHHNRAYGPGGLGASYFALYPDSNGIRADYSGLTVDNCEISGFAYGGVNLHAGQGHKINNNSIHHCQFNGYGYGVVLNNADAVIESNEFDYNRHSIAGTGQPTCAYIARNNIELGNSLSHVFDMHAKPNPDGGADIAGDFVTIANNTIHSTEYSARIRGVPVRGANIYQNHFVNRALGASAITTEGNSVIENNLYDDPPILVASE